MTTTDIRHYIESEGRAIELELERLIPIHHGPFERLFNAARYALLGGGKRLRPILTLATVQMLGGNPRLALTPACTLELVHTYSMIHDDLPCMDNDDYRRGKLTVHKQYSEGHAVLTGDYLLTYAFEILAASPHLDAETKIELVATLAHRSGSDGMIGGQVMDLAYEGKKIPLDTLRLLHRNKTAALIMAAIEFGGIIAKATPLQLNHLRQFGESIGLAFQIIDDILDVTSSKTKHGKAISSDILNDKSTYVSLLGVDQAREYAQNLYDQSILALKPITTDTSLLVALADFVLKREN